MSDLAQWIAYQRRAAVFGTSEETVLALLDVAEAAEERSAAEGAYAVEGDGGGPAAWRLFRAKTALDAAIARLVEVKHG